LKQITLLEVLDAAHLTKYVNGPFKQRGGIMLIGPPGAMKTTYQQVLEDHHDALVMGDINIQTLHKLKEDLRSGRFSTFAFTEFEKLYQRRADTATNIEGAIKQLVEEGYTKPSFVDQRVAASRAYCMVIGAMTSDFYERQFNEWEKSGFLRRFLWCNYSIANPWVHMDAIARWERLDLGSYKSKVPGNRSIPHSVDQDESYKLRGFLKEQPGTTTPFVLMNKILSVLKWKYGKTEPKKPMQIVADFAQCLRRDGAEIELEEEKDKK